MKMYKDIIHLMCIKIMNIWSFFLKFCTLMQHTSMSPDRKLLTVVGDDCDGLLVDARNGRVSLIATGSYNETLFSFIWT